MTSGPGFPAGRGAGHGGGSRTLFLPSDAGQIPGAGVRPLGEDANPWEAAVLGTLVASPSAPSPEKKSSVCRPSASLGTPTATCPGPPDLT